MNTQVKWHIHPFNSEAKVYGRTLDIGDTVIAYMDVYPASDGSFHKVDKHLKLKSSSPVHIRPQIEGHKLELDDYEIANLLNLLKVASKTNLNTGDWLHQIINKIDIINWDKTYRSNVSVEEQLKELKFKRYLNDKDI